MRRALSIAVGLLLAGCGGPPVVDLPRIGTAGDRPPADETVEVTLRADGTILAEGEPVDLFGLHAVLKARTADQPRDERFPMRPSRLNVLLSCDAGAAVGDLREVLSAVVDPEVRAPHVFFAVEHEGGGDGAFAWFLPHDGGCLTDPPFLETTVRVDVGPGGYDPLALYAALRALPEERRVGAGIAADPRVRVGDLLRVADLCLRAGVKAIALVAPPEAGTGSGLRIDGAPVGPPGPDAAGPPPVPRARGVAGFARDVRREDPVIREAKERAEEDMPPEESLGK